MFIQIAERKWIIITVFVLGLISVSSANALQEVAGPIIFRVAAGGTNSSQYGLVNDGNETIVVSLRAEGDIAKYLSFPENVSLEPKKVVYVNVTASLPSDYNQGQNITGFLYTLQEGKPGQVKINIQLMKSVTIIPTSLVQTAPTNNGTVSVVPQQNPLTGLFAFTSNYSIPIVIFVIDFIVIVFILYGIQRKRGGGKK